MTQPWDIGFSTPAFIPGTVVAGWCQLDDIVNEAAAILRLDNADPDFDRLYLYAGATCYLIHDYLARPTPFPPGRVPAPVLRAAALTCVRLYKSKDATFGVLGGWSDSDAGPLRIGEDWLSGVLHLLLPFKQAFGVA